MEKGNIFELMGKRIEEFCKTRCAGPMIYKEKDEMGKLFEFFCNDCPFIRQYTLHKVEKGEKDDSNIHGRNGGETKTR